ncbi:hypothetical protein HY413_01430 [Candidatus Kaiserbacteria bacterium]|nr:hypothetical protein [Candidatus Kaiserbacteria bacterium]
MLGDLFRRKNPYTHSDLTPGDIFLDSSNLAGMAVEQFEGRIEKPVASFAIFLVGVVFVLAALIFGWRMFELQVRKGADYALAAQENRLVHSLLFAERGVIYDRTGKELAWNEAAFAAEGSTSTEPLLPYSLRRYSELPGLAHVLGYVRYPKADSSGVWWRTDLTGVSGAELIFNDQMAGKNGTEMAEVDVRNVIHRRSLIERPRGGRNITLSIDAEMQSKLYTTLAQHAKQFNFVGGAGMIIDVTTGEIIALTSVPEYSSQALTSGDQTEVSSFSSDQRKPFLNRALSGVYTPGSIVKPFFAAAALQEGIITPEKSIFSPGFISIPNLYNPDKPSIIKDWRAHGWTAMREAISVSSDVYFFSIGGGYEDQEGLGIARINTWARAFGLGRATGFDFAGEADGVIPTPAWKKEVFGENEPWRLGDTYNTSIGQYGFQVTPAQMVRAVAAIANGGRLPALQIIASSTPAYVSVGISDEHLAVVREGMRLAVTSDKGTARALNIPGFPIAGKTGTAEVGSKKQFMNSWVIGFWPYDKPKYAFAVVLERAPAGTLSGAAPAMRGFFDWLAQRPVEAVSVVQDIEIAR